MIRLVLASIVSDVLACFLLWWIVKDATGQPVGSWYHYLLVGVVVRLFTSSNKSQDIVKKYPASLPGVERK